jgi:hypothetical protein
MRDWSICRQKSVSQHKKFACNVIMGILNGMGRMVYAKLVQTKSAGQNLLSSGPSSLSFRT